MKMSIFHHNVKWILSLTETLLEMASSQYLAVILFIQGCTWKIRNNSWECIILFSSISLVPTLTLDLCSGCSICLPENSQGLYNNLNPIKASHWDSRGPLALCTWVTFTIKNDPYNPQQILRPSLKEMHVVYNLQGEYCFSILFHFIRQESL